MLDLQTPVDVRFCQGQSCSRQPSLAQPWLQSVGLHYPERKGPHGPCPSPCMCLILSLFTFGFI